MIFSKNVLLFSIPASLLMSSPSASLAGGDQETLKQTCASFYLEKIDKRLLAAVSSLGQQQFQTEIHFIADKENISKVRFTFHDAATNRNFAKCEAVNDEVQITIPFNYGQLPVFMNMWRIARSPKENKSMKCRVDFNNDEAFRRGSCDLEDTKG